MTAVLRRLALLLDEALDQIPAYEDGRWLRHGQWGCQLRLSRFWLSTANPPNRNTEG